MYKKFIEIAALLAIIIIGNNLRNYSYASVPQPGENTDEYAYAWAGLTLITKGVPEAWSQFPEAYKLTRKEKINVDNIFNKNPDYPSFSMVKPWFDNPPMLGLITGGYAYMKGVRTLDEMSVIIIRRPMLKIAILTTILLYIFAKLLFNTKVGLLSALLYSTIPSVVISSRLALAENILAPLFLTTAIFVLLYLKNQNKSYWLTACFIASFSILFKISAIAFPLALFFCAIKFGGKQKLNIIKNLMFALSLAIGTYVLYGFILGFDEFIKLFIYQSQRFYGASSEAFYQAFTSVKITKNLTDGWLNMAWVSALILSLIGFKKKGYQSIIIIFLFSYLSVFLILGSEAYGHYRFPFYPFLVLCSAYILINLFQKPNIFLFITLILLPLGTTVHRLIGVVGFQKYVPLFRYGVVTALIAYLLFLVKPKTGIWAYRVFMVIILILTVYLSIKEIYFFNIDKWYFAN